MAGLVPAIHVFALVKAERTWTPGTSPGMTEMAVVDGRLHVIASEAKQSIWHPRNERKEWIASSLRSSQ
jgi:hypothetical protein